jgi:hypothetical protein
MGKDLWLPFECGYLGLTLLICRTIRKIVELITK